MTGRSRGRLVADAADGADDIFLSCTYPASGPAFPAEGNVDAQCPQEHLRATQAASEGAGIFGSASAPTQKVVAATVGVGPPKLGGTARP